MKPIRYQRQSPEQWQTIIAAFHQSGISAPIFCQEQGISYASFCKWRHKIIEPATPTKTCSEARTTSSFIDLQALAASSGSTWNITLKLGNGVELNLSQA
jgi:putative transposase